MPGDSISERMMIHLAEIAYGDCSITPESVDAEPSNEVQQVLNSLLMLHEELEYARSQDEARVAAEAADRAKSVFLTTMSHELRTPLNAILGYSELATEELEAEGDVTQVLADLGRVKAAGQHLLQLINDVLDLARIEAGEVELQQAEFDISEVVAEALRTLEPLAGKKQIALRSELQSHRWTGDRRRLLQCVLNLGMNAVKFTTQGEIVLRIRVFEGDAWIDVQDTGPGIPRASQELIFQPFAQTAIGRDKGTGLGLAITRRLVESMGGSIALDSLVGRGTTFSLSLPRALRA